MLNSDEIRHLIENHQLITEYVDLDKQVQSSGFDLSLKEVHNITGSGSIDFSNKERVIAEYDELHPDSDGWWSLQQGCYMIVYNEIVSMPLDVSAIARSRSTVLRNGATVETAVWDPGYKGRSSSLLVVHNLRGLKLKKDARVAQLIFFHIKNVEKGYDGVYQNERVTK